MKKTIFTTMAALGLCLGGSASAATIITQWDFNTQDGAANTGTLTPSVGTGTAATVGTVVTTFNLSYNSSTTSGSSDPLGIGVENSAWRMANNWPAQGTGNKTCGVQLNISTVGYENITLSWDHANSPTANKYYRVQYTIDNGSTWVDKDVVVNNQVDNIWNNPIATVSFATIPGANNNPDFGVRILSEFQSTAVGGSPAYVAINGGTYGVTSVLRLDMITFSGDIASGQVNILTNPSNQVVAVGQPAEFVVTAGGGTSTITYQWWKNSVALPAATNSVYAIAAAQHADAGSYEVVVSNAVNSQTSAVATLTVRDPLNLAWTGLNSAVWDSTSLNWVNTGNSSDVAYTTGDRVLFDSRGVSAPTVSLAESFNPSSLTVDADFDYTLRSDVGGNIAGACGLTKRGSGTLILDIDNTYSGPTVIQAGAVQVGAADAHGSMGSGSITNDGGLVFNRSDTIIVANNIVGNGGITNIGKAVLLSGSNIYNGPVASKSGSLVLSGNQVVNSSELFVVASTAIGVDGATKLGIADGMVIGPGTTIRLTGSLASPDVRCTFLSNAGTNIVNGPIVLEGSGNNGISADNASEIRLNGTLSGAPGFNGSLTLRGVGTGFLNGTVSFPGGVVHKTDKGTWTVNSTGNSWWYTSLAVGTLRIGAHNALPTTLGMSIGQASAAAKLDLAGFNQQIGALADGGGTQIITNSSATADSTLTIGSGIFSGSIADSTAGGKTSLTLNGSFTLAGFNTYRGDTTVAAGTLSLSGVGDIPNSAVINLAGGALDVSARYDGTLPVYAGQTLKGNGTLAVTGNLVNNGTIELKVNKSGGIVTNDKLSVTGQLTCGGTLKLNLAGQALNWADILPVFVAGSHGGIIPAIEPAVPAPGATWDTSTLLTDGKLRIYGPPTVTSTVVSGTNVSLSGFGGEAFGTFSVLSATDVEAPAAGWTTVQTGSFDASGNFSVSFAITPGEPRRFYQLQIP